MKNKLLSYLLIVSMIMSLGITSVYAENGNRTDTDKESNDIMEEELTEKEPTEENAVSQKMLTSHKAAANGATGNLTVIGGSLGTDYTYADNTLKILTGTALTISGTSENTDRIVVDGANANITIKDLSVEFKDGWADSNAGTCAFEIKNSGKVNLNIQGANSFKSGSQKAGILVDDDSYLCINGTGSLEVKGGRRSAGIGSNANNYVSKKTCSGTIEIKGGTVNATGGELLRWNW